MIYLNKTGLTAVPSQSTRRIQRAVWSGKNLKIAMPINCAASERLQLRHPQRLSRVEERCKLATRLL